MKICPTGWCWMSRTVLCHNGNTILD
jgi:hypothetical protein